jgi:hypothetical protein
MARFAFSMQASLAGLFGRPRVSDHSLRALCMPGIDEALTGPGWYDSSHELRRGLDVLEGLPSDTAVEDWLTLWLCTTESTPSPQPSPPSTVEREQIEEATLPLPLAGEGWGEGRRGSQSPLPAPPSATYNHALALSHLRLTVRSVTPWHSAISASL